MKKIIHLAAASLVAVSLLASCASTDGSAKSDRPAKTKKVKFDAEQFKAAFDQGQFGACAAMLKGKQAANTLVKDSLDADILNFMAGQYLESGRGGMETKTAMQSVSDSMTAGKVLQAALVGENSIIYSGSLYERYYLYSLRVMDAIQLKAIDGALGVMSDYTGTFQEVIEKYRNAQDEITKESVKSTTGENIDKMMEQCAKYKLPFSKEAKIFTDAPVGIVPETYMSSPLLGYLGTVVYAANQGPDNDHRDHATKFASDTLMNTNKAVFDDLEADVLVPAGKGRIDVVALSGTIGKREEFTTGVQPLFVFDGIPVMYKITYPMFDAAKQNHAIASVKATLTNGDASELILVEDFDKAVTGDVAARAAGARSRSITRNIVKNVTAVGSVVAADVVASNAPNEMAKKIAAASAAAAKIALPAVMDKIIDAEHADIRQCEYLPHMASAKGFTVDPGVYGVKVEYLDKNGGVVATDESIKEVIVEEGKPTVVVSSCRK